MRELRRLLQPVMLRQELWGTGVVAVALRLGETPEPPTPAPCRPERGVAWGLAPPASSPHNALG